jgi:ribonuclease P/MRP protein subunit POP5
MRFKNRYLLIQLVFPSSSSLSLPALTSYQLYSILRTSLITNFGEFGYGQVTASFQVKHCNARTGLAIIRAPRDDWEVVRSAIVLGVREVGGEECVMRVLAVSGTIRGVQKAAVRWTREVLMGVWKRRVEERRAGSEEVREREARKVKEEVESYMQEAEKEINALET